MASSDVGRHLCGLPDDVHVAAYVDDISLSSDDGDALEAAYETTLRALAADGFAISTEKLRPPSEAIDIFNCDLSEGVTTVRDERIDQFFREGPSPAAEEAFVAYCATVEDGNTP